MVFSRWAMVSTVHPLNCLRIMLWIRASVSESTEEVAGQGGGELAMGGEATTAKVGRGSQPCGKVTGQAERVCVSGGEATLYACSPARYAPSSITKILGLRSRARAMHINCR